MPVGRTLRDRGVALDHANAVPCRMQLISGGDTADTAADDDDIHDSFAPEGVTLAKRARLVVWRGVFASVAVKCDGPARRENTRATSPDESAP